MNLTKYYEWGFDEPLFPRDGSITKGDLPGHVFHGNQFVEVGGAGTTTSARKPRAKSPTIAGLPKGWKLKSKDGSRIVLTSKNGNTAIFATRARGWKPTEKYSQMVLETIENQTSGKTVNFVAEANVGRDALAYVTSADPNIVNMGRYSEVVQTLDHQREQFEKQVTNTALVGADLSLALMEMAKGTPEREELITKMAELYDQQPRTEAMTNNLHNSCASFVSPQKIIETMVAHELGHSDFFSEGHKISEIYPALTEAVQAAGVANRWAISGSYARFTDASAWEASQRDAYAEVLRGTPRKYTGFDVGNGVVVSRADYIDYRMKEGSGSYPVSVSTQKVLREIGVTTYGSTKLQEVVAEARAMYSVPQLPKSALTMRIAGILGWDKTNKSAKLWFMKSEDDLPPVSANEYLDKDGNLIARVFDNVDTSGVAITIVGTVVFLPDGTTMSLADYNATH